MALPARRDIGQIDQVPFARGGAGYTGQTTLSFGPAVGAGAAATPVIVSGAIMGATMCGARNGYSQLPVVAINDFGGRTGAVLTAIAIGTGGYAIGALDARRMEAFVPLMLNGGALVARNVPFMGDANNLAHRTSLADSKASILSICRALTAGGVGLIAVAPLDRASKSD